MALEARLPWSAKDATRSWNDMVKEQCSRGFVTGGLLNLVPGQLKVTVAAFASVGSAVEAMRAGAADYITKPFDVQELRLRVRNALRRSQQGALSNPVTNLPEGALVDERLAALEGDKALIEARRVLGRPLAVEALSQAAFDRQLSEVYAGDHLAATDGDDLIVLVDATLGAVTITLYTAVGNSGKKVRVVKTDSSANTVTIDTSAPTITSVTGFTANGYYNSVNVFHFFGWLGSQSKKLSNSKNQSGLRDFPFN